MLDLISKILARKGIKELIKYGIVGVIGLIIDMGIYYLLVRKLETHYPFSISIKELFGLGMSVRMIDILISNIISQTLAIINNFILNSYFTFKVTNNKLKRFSSFVGVAAIGMIISSALLTLFIEKIGLSDMFAKILAILIVALIQFIINKYLTFKKTAE